MKRRVFGLMTACAGSALAAGIGFPRRASAAATAAQIASLQTTLTPMGSERAGNAAGTIPAWTGGLTTLPAGWTDTTTPMPNPFPDDKPQFSIDASNLSKYQDQLTPGVIALIKEAGLVVNVYQTRRTHALPQWVYDNIAKNAATAVVGPGGARLGWSNAFGGYPFPFPDASDPFEAGAQIIWNHQYKWQGEHETYVTSDISVVGGQRTLLSVQSTTYRYPCYTQGGSYEQNGKYLYQLLFVGTAPANNVGAQEEVWSSTNPLVWPTIAWTYLNGQGRVRKVPEVQYDIPEAQSNGLTNYDENWLFGGAMDRYDWKYLGKKEMFIPYNNDKVVQMSQDSCLQNAIDPEVTRWELHRVHVVDATLHPGERHVVPRRTLYLDEDSWFGALQDEYDAQGNLWKVGMDFVMNRPDLPGLLYSGCVIYNLQQKGYVLTSNTDLSKPAGTHTFDFITKPADNLFNPQTMGDRAQY